jgi:hypothetical protein
MEQTNYSGSIDVKTATKALEELKPELARIPVQELESPRVDLLKVVSLAMQVSRIAKEDRRYFDTTFRTFPLEYIDRLDIYALALWAAETEYRRRQLEEDVQRIPPTELIEAARSLKDHLLAAAAYIWRQDTKIQEMLNDIRRGTGYFDLADDLNRLNELFTAHWSMVQGRSEVTQDIIREAGAKATELIRILIINQPETLRPWTDLRLRAWTQLRRAYDEIREGAAYIFRKQPERLSNYASFFSNPRRNNKSHQEKNNQESKTAAPAQASTQS